MMHALNPSIDAYNEVSVFSEKTKRNCTVAV